MDILHAGVSVMVRRLVFKTLGNVAVRIVYNKNLHKTFKYHIDYINLYNNKLIILIYKDILSERLDK